MTERAGATSAARHLGLADTVSIIVGIVVGTAIFVSPPLVARNVSSPGEALTVWALGGLLSLFGAFCYAELATTYPRSGGDYEYLSRAFGPWAGFLFAWTQLVVVLTGSIGAMAYAFAEYGVAFWGLARDATVLLAAGAIVLLSAVNLAGVVAGKSAQNVLAFAKVAGLSALIVSGLWGSPGEASAALPASASGSLGLALVFVLYAFGGWNDAAFVAAEVRDPERNIPRSLFLSIFLITALYLLVNAACLAVLGFEGLRASSTPAADVLDRTVGPWASRAVSALVMVSALGAVNGLIFTGSRLLRSFGEDHRLFSFLSRDNRRLNAPVGALLAQASVSLLLVLGVGTDAGRATIDGALAIVGIAPLPWQRYYGGFETLVASSAPVFWTFFLMTGLALFVLRWKDGERRRPFRTPLYPLPPVVFCLGCIFMLHSSLEYAGALVLFAIVPTALGLPLYVASRQLETRDANRR